MTKITFDIISMFISKNTELDLLLHKEYECSCFIEFIKQAGGKAINCLTFYRFFATSLINSIIWS